MRGRSTSYSYLQGLSQCNTTQGALGEALDARVSETTLEERMKAKMGTERGYQDRTPLYHVFGSRKQEGGIMSAVRSENANIGAY